MVCCQVAGDSELIGIRAETAVGAVEEVVDCAGKGSSAVGVAGDPRGVDPAAGEAGASAEVMVAGAGSGCAAVVAGHPSDVDAVAGSAVIAFEEVSRNARQCAARRRTRDPRRVWHTAKSAIVHVQIIGRGARRGVGRIVAVNPSVRHFRTRETCRIAEVMRQREARGGVSRVGARGPICIDGGTVCADAVDADEGGCDACRVDYG